MSTISKGTAWARKVHVMLERAGVVQRSMWLDAGDDMTLTLFDGRVLSVEAKDQRAYSFGTWLDQAVRQARPSHIPVVIAHRKGKASAEEAFVVMRASDFVGLVMR